MAESGDKDTRGNLALMGHNNLKPGFPGARKNILC